MVYGRRRVGKPELLKEFCTDRSHIYFLAAQEAEDRQREKFVEKVADYFDDRVPRIDGWDEALNYLGEKLTTEQLVVAIDEFPYRVEENDSLQSYLQPFVDEQLQETDSMLVLCWIQREHDGVRGARPREPTVRPPHGTNRRIAVFLPAGP